MGSAVSWVVLCRNCGLGLSQPLRKIEFPGHKSGAPAEVPAGTVAVDPIAVIETRTLGPNGPTSISERHPAGTVVIHPDDAVNMASAGCDNGCCGSDGLDGPNRACRCGTMVATAYTDCWTRLAVRFISAATLLHEDGQYPTYPGSPRSPGPPRPAVS